MPDAPLGLHRPPDETPGEAIGWRTVTDVVPSEPGSPVHAHRTDPTRTLEASK